MSEAYQIVTETEAEWDRRDRADMLTLAAFERSLCACGWSSVITGDPDTDIDINDRTCPVCAGADLHARRLASADEEARGPKPDPDEPAPADGRRIVSSLAHRDSP